MPQPSKEGRRETLPLTKADLTDPAAVMGIGRGEERLHRRRLQTMGGRNHQGEATAAPWVRTKRPVRGAMNDSSWGCATSAKRWVTARRLVPTSSVFGVAKRGIPCATAPLEANLQWLRLRVVRCATLQMSRLRRAPVAHP